MVWINLFLFLSISFAATPEKFLTKHDIASIRYISMDGRFAYVKKRPGVMALVSYFRSVDFISDSAQSDFVVSVSESKRRVAIEIIRNAHTELNFFKNNRIMLVNWGETVAKEVGSGQNAKLHLGDEWLSFYDAYKKTISILNVVTQKKYEIRLAEKNNVFFIPDVIMMSSENVVYTDINEQGHAATIGYNLLTGKSTVIYKSSQSGTRTEVCRSEDYLAIGEFPYEGVTRGSKLLHIKASGSYNLSGYTTLYESVDQDLGNILCLNDSVYFIKTMNQDKKIGIKTTEAVKFELKTSQLKVRTSMGNVTQLLEMDGRVMAPIRGDFYVLEGEPNLSTDILKNNKKEELPLEI